MTDSIPNDSTSQTPGSDVDLEALVNEYIEGIQNPTGAGGLSWLDARSTIEAENEHLTTAQIERVAKADRELIGRAGEIADQIEESSIGSLSAIRANTQRPTDEWWWYLDVLDSVSDYYSGRPVGQTEKVVSRIIDVLLLVALGVLAFLLIRNWLPQVTGANSSTAIPTVPTATSAPTQTLDAGAFDIKTAKSTKSDDGVVQIMLPSGWQAQPQRSPYTYQYSYGPVDSPTLMVVVFVGSTDLYKNILELTGPATTPKDAFAEFQKEQASNTDLKFGTVHDVKFSTATSASAMPLHVSGASSGRNDTDLEFWFGTLPDGTVIGGLIQADSTQWSKAQPTMYSMLTDVIINSNKIPSATPTPTYHPLLLTATALQNQINALTPTATSTPTATPVGGVGTAEAPF